MQSIKYDELPRNVSSVLYLNCNKSNDLQEEEKKHVNTSIKLMPRKKYDN